MTGYRRGCNAQALRTWFEASGFDQEALAYVVGADQSSVSRWLSGDQRPGLDALAAIMVLSMGQVVPTDFLTASECRRLRQRVRRARARRGLGA